MLAYTSNKRFISFVLLVSLLFSFASVSVFAENTEITEGSTYVLNRDANGEHLYLYQSPCMIGYDINKMYGGNGVPIQAFVFTMYNSVTGEHFPTYCSDINVTAVQGADYRRVNLEDAPFSGSSAGRVRAILQEGFYILPINGESDAAHAERVNAKVAGLAQASGAEGLTAGEAIAATQAAIWQVVHGTELSFPNFCRYVFKPTNTKYVSLCSYDELRYKDTALINSTIWTVYDYLTSLKPVKATQKTVSPASFTELNDPVLTKNADGSYNVSVTAGVDVDMVAGDSLSLKAHINENYVVRTALRDGKQNVTVTLENVPADVASDDVTLSISGYQTSEGYFYFDAEGDRGSSQAMVGYDNSRLPVYAEVVASRERVLNICKTTRVQLEDGSYENKPLSNIIFDIYPVVANDEYYSGNYTLPDINEFDYPELAEYSVMTDDYGRASFNFTKFGLPDGVYLVAERRHPSIVEPIEPFYLNVPMTSADGTHFIYDISIEPKNEVKGDVTIDKDISSIGNNGSSVNAYEPHTWIISTTIPEDISTGRSYVITDTLDNRLDYLGNMKVVLEDNTEAADTDLTANKDYKLILTDSDSVSEGKPSDAFSIELTGTGMKKISTAIGDNSFENYVLRVYFDAQINANAEMGSDIYNSAQLSYVNAVNFEFFKNSDTPYVSTGGANLLKVDSENAAETLSGAVFEVYRMATQEEIAANDSRITVIPGVVGKVIKVSFYDNAELQGDKVTSAASDEDGKVVIYGLDYGKYYLQEIKAPAGYNLLADPIEITIDASSHTEENVITVKNYSGVVLPTTGGMGTALYTVGGIILMGSACLLCYLNKRRSLRS